jgi:hypothetical protein
VKDIHVLFARLHHQWIPYQAGEALERVVRNVSIAFSRHLQFAFRGAAWTPTIAACHEAWFFLPVASCPSDDEIDAMRKRVNACSRETKAAPPLKWTFWTKNARFRFKFLCTASASDRGEWHHSCSTELLVAPKLDAAGEFSEVQQHWKELSTSRCKRRHARTSCIPSNESSGSLIA